MPDYWQLYQEALAAERAARLHVYLPINEKLGPFEVRHMTLLDHVRLSEAGNPFVAGGVIDPDAVWQLCWNQSAKGKTTDRGPRRWIFMLRFLLHRGYLELVNDCRRFVRESMMDLPKSAGGPSSKPYMSWMANIIDIIASEYGWSRQEIINMPLRELGQYLKAIRRRKDSKAPLFNESDSLFGKAVLQRAGALNEEAPNGN